MDSTARRISVIFICIVSHNAFALGLNSLSDALAAYVDATEQAFGTKVDYGQAVKFYHAGPIELRRYSPPHVVHSERPAIVGDPDEATYQQASLSGRTSQ